MLYVEEVGTGVECDVLETHIGWYPLVVGKMGKIATNENFNIKQFRTNAWVGGDLGSINADEKLVITTFRVSSLPRTHLCQSPTVNPVSSSMLAMVMFDPFEQCLIWRTLLLGANFGFAMNMEGLPWLGQLADSP